MPFNIAKAGYGPPLSVPFCTNHMSGTFTLDHSIYVSGDPIVATANWTESNGYDGYVNVNDNQESKTIASSGGTKSFVAGLGNEEIQFTASDFLNPCTNDNGIKTLTYQITGYDMPTATISATPSVISEGGQTNIEWSSTYTSSCMLYENDIPKQSQPMPISGSVTYLPETDNTVYRILCYAEGGGSTAEDTVTVSFISIDLTFNLYQTFVGESVFGFTEHPGGSTSCNVTSNPTTVLPIGGYNCQGNFFEFLTLPFSLPGSYVFTSNVTYPAGSDSNSKTVIVSEVGSTPPTVTTPTATNPTHTTVTLNANVTSLGTPATLTAPKFRGFCYDINSDPSWEDGDTCVTEGGTTATPYSKNITNLTPNTTYHFRGYATNATGTGYTEDATFTTTAVTVSVTASPLDYTKNPGTNISFTYTPTTNIGTTQCRLLDYLKNEKLPLTNYQASSPIIYNAPSNAGNYGYYIQCKNVTYQTVTAFSDIITVHVNFSPVVSAGPDKIVTLVPPSTTGSVSVTGTATDPDGGSITSVWTYRSGPTNYTIQSPNSLTTNITGLTVGTYVFRLTVTDNGGLAPYDEMQVIVNNTPTNALYVNKTGTGSGIVASTPSGISCGEDCGEGFTTGTPVTLTASPGTNSFFGGWSGGGCSETSPTCTLTMNSEITVTATFTAVTISVTASPLTYQKAPSESISFSYTTTTNIGTTECRLEDYANEELKSYQASSPIIYNAPPNAGDYGYYIRCRNTSYTAVRAISNMITVYVNLPNTVPTVINPSVNPIGETTATLHAEVTSKGNPPVLINRGFCYVLSTQGNPDLDNDNATCVPEGGTTTGSYSKNITGLTVNTQYKYSGYANNSSGTGYTSTETFTTTANPLGTINATDCFISLNNSSCNTNLIWNITNASGNSYIEQPLGTAIYTTVFPETTGTGSKSVSYNTPKTFYLYHPTKSNGTPPGTKLGEDTATATCAPGLEWSALQSKCITDGQNSPVGIITSNNCVIGSGQSTCNDINLTWTTEHTILTPQIKLNPSIADFIFSGISGTNEDYPITFGNTTFYLLDGNNQLSSTIAKGVCYPGTQWNSTKCAPKRIGMIVATNCEIPAGQNKCTTSLTFGIQSPIGPSQVTTPGPTLPIVVYDHSGAESFGPITQNYFPVEYPGRDFYLYDASSLLSQAKAKATCVDGTEWRGTKCEPTLIPHGEISATDCTIPLNGSTCNSTLNWYTENLTATPAVTRNNPDIIVSNAPSGNNVLNAINPGFSTFYIYHLEVPLDETRVFASCGPNIWNGTICIENTNMFGTLTPSVNPCIIASGANSCTTDLTWSIDNTEEVISQITANEMAPINLDTPTIGNDYSGTKTATVPYPSRTFFLYNNEKSLVPTAESPYGTGVNVTANCISGTTWNVEAGKCIPSTGFPELSSSAPTPSTVIAGIPTEFSLTVTNSGTAPTTVSFDNLFQTAQGFEGGGEPVGLKSYLIKMARAEDGDPLKLEDWPASEQISILAPGQSATATATLKFEEGPTYYVRGCADKKSAGDTGLITEENEDDNCSGWGSVEVVPVPFDGGWSDWVCGSCSKLCGSGTQSCKRTCTNPLLGCEGPDTREQLCNEQACGGGDENGVLGLTFSASPTWIFKGRSSTLTWTTNTDPATTSCVGTGDGFDTGNKPSGSDLVNPTVTTTYGITCTKGTETESASVKVKVINPIIIEN